MTNRRTDRQLNQKEYVSTVSGVYVCVCVCWVGGGGGGGIIISNSKAAMACIKVEFQRR